MGLNMPEDGYLYVYVSNESQKDVNFDNLQIGHSSTHLTEINDYYPYGLLISNNSSFGSTAQNYKYNGKELQTDLSFNVEDYGARYYDPVIGRWMQVDPLAEMYRKWSPYNYCVDNPIRFIDPDGMGVGNNSQQAETEKNKKPIIPTTARDNTSTSSVDPTIHDKCKTAEGSFWRFGRALDKSLQGSHNFKPLGKSNTWKHGVVVNGDSKNQENGIKATGSVLEIEQSELKILQDIAGASSNSNDVKIMPSAESVVNKKKSSDNVHYTEYENSTTYEVASDTTIPIGGGHDGNKVYYPGDTMTKVIITKNPVDGQYHYENIPWK